MPDEELNLDRQLPDMSEGSMEPIEIIDDQIDSEDITDTTEASNDTEDVDANVQVDEDTSKRADNDLVDEYLKVSSRCILCSTPIWSVKLNKAYLDGATYSEMIGKFSSKFEERTGRSLNKSLLHRHFNQHFDARASAISQYNKSRSNPGATASGTQRDIFKIATQKYIDELNLHDVTIKELIGKYSELEDIISTKKDKNDRNIDIEDLVLKQVSILDTLAKQSLNKFKALSKVDLESKQGQFLSQLSFIGSAAMIPGPGGKQQMPKIDPKELENLYLTSVINQLIGRASEAVRTTFKATPDDQRVFLRDLKKSMSGVSDAIKIDFDKRIEQEQNNKQQKLIEKKESD